VTGTAVEVTRGAIRVVGAGLRTSTAAFIAQGTSGNVGVHTFPLDNPLINGDPNALLFVSRRESAHAEQLNGHTVFYKNGIWYVQYKIESQIGLEVYRPGPFFNVLVIKS
jgi:hypothetical protein